MQIFSNFQSLFTDPKSFLLNILILLPGIIIGLSFHEFAHAWMADKLGDPTPRNQGRVTIWPLAHIDPFGFAMLFLFGFGYGRPVQINPANLRKRRRDEILVSLAGVSMNFVIALLSVFLIHLLIFVFHIYNLTVLNIIDMTIYININLIIFNLLPIPPLDGYRVVRNLFLHKNINLFWRLDQYGNIILLVLLFTGLLTSVLSACSGAVYNFLYNLAGLFFR